MGTVLQGEQLLMDAPILIAEVGNNHEGSLDAAIEMMERAWEAGADMVKFQAGNANGFARRVEDIPRYRAYELGRVGYDCLIKRGKELGIHVFFSVWSEEYDDFRKLEWFKIPARQCRADQIREYATPKTFISIPHTNDTPGALGIRHGIPLHCVSQYPARDGMLSRIGQLRDTLKMPVGYSDHTIGIDACVEAAKLGAVAIEKHFTLKHDFGPLRDHALSAIPWQFREMVGKIRSSK
jgi:N,N'-diacetyllegionaminate synthase